MTHFDDLQALWQQQAAPGQRLAAEAIIAQANQSHRTLKNEHWGTLLILSTTGLLVGGYVWWYQTTTQPTALRGSGLMLLSLLVRLGVEYGSYRLFARIKPTTDLRTCLAQLRRFGRLRRGIYWVITPLSLGSYVWGFVLLLPYVKVAVSPGFYGYILTSGLVFGLVLGIIIYRQLRREVRLLSELEASYVGLMTD